MTGGSFTERVRQELSGTPVDPAEAVPELAVLLRLTGTLHRVGTTSGSRTTLEVTTTSGAAVRRIYRLLPSVTPVRPELWVRAPAGVRTASTYGLVVTRGVEELTERAGLWTVHGHVSGLPGTPTPQVAARASLMTVAALSDPGREVHAELRVPSEAVGRDLRSACQQLGVRALLDTDRDRVVVKSGAQVARLLGAAGAPRAAGELDERRRRRHLRNEATRLANADAANLRRTIEAAESQLDDIERAVAHVGWGGLDEQLRDLALARMVNPGASLSELGQLCDPPVGKSAVHRRLRRLRDLAEGHPATGDD